MAKKFPAALRPLSNEDIEPIPVLPTGSILLDKALGVGGWPRGKLTELYGEESSGKTTLSLATAAVCQRGGGAVLLNDYENSFDPAYAVACGVSLDRDAFILSQPDSLEQGMELTSEYLKAKAVALVIFDSLAAMACEEELKGEFTDAHRVAPQARAMSLALRRMVPIIADSGAVVIFINHVHVVIGGFNPRGIVRKTTPGGKALKFYSAIRVEIARTGRVNGNVLNFATGELEDGPVAYSAKATVVKNKVASPYRKAELFMDDHGVNETMTLVEIAIARGIIKKAGSRYTLPFAKAPGEGPTIILGIQNVYEHIEDNPARFRSLRQFVIAALDEEAPVKHAADSPDKPDGPSDYVAEHDPLEVEE